MMRYTCYVIYFADQVSSVAEIECNGDNTACAEAEEILAECPAHGVELWRNESTRPSSGTARRA